MDRFLKFNSYKQAGVREYWIVEPEAKLVNVFVLQDNQRYGRPETYTDDEESLEVNAMHNWLLGILWWN